MNGKPSKSLSTDAAETLAISGLGYLASDGEQLERFLSLSGLTPANVRAAASDPGFLRAVLEHIAGDESLLLAFAANEQIRPEAVQRAVLVLGGGSADWSP